jgi:adrenodoxin-NADP+ reductase
MTLASTKSLRIALVGAGPANLYVGMSLQKLKVKIDVYDRLPAPYGLVRGGVAPDHQDVKKVVNKFKEFLGKSSFRGGVNLQKLTLNRLMKTYHGVVLGYGCSKDRKGLDGAVPSGTIVGWYNGKPSLKYSNWKLPDTNSVIIIGHGNVGLDIARILLKDTRKLENSDITSYSLNCLKNSNIKEIHIIGRRGAMESAFSLKELKQLKEIQDTRIVVDQEYIIEILKENQDKLANDRPKRRMLEWLAAQNSNRDYKKTIYFHFRKSPEKIVYRKEQVTGVLFEKRQVKDGLATGTGEFETIQGGLVVTAIGYEGERVDPDIPWDFRKNIVPNIHGRVLGKNGVIPGLYVAGWLKDGPVGTIATTHMSAMQTGACILEDYLKLGETNQPTMEVDELLRQSGVQPISWNGWEKIDKFEIESGQKVGKIREKIVSIDKMYSISKYPEES